MQVLLRVSNGKSNVRKVRLNADTIIGRSPECQLKVASNQISRKHCQILIRETYVAIKDLSSANGTFVNGRQVPPEVEIPLTPGTRVMLGPLHFTVEYELPGTASTSAVAGNSGAAKELSPREGSELASVEAAAPIEFEGPLGAGDEDESGDLAATGPVPEVSGIPTFEAAAANKFAVPAMSTSPGAKQALVNGTPVAPAEPTMFMVQSPLAHPRPENLAPTAPIATPAVPIAQPVLAQPAPTAAAAPLPPVYPPRETSAPSDVLAEHDDPSFHFGIFAASGSGVVVESSPEVPIFVQPEDAEVETPPPPPKPARKSLLEMFGWGKKKAETPPAETPPSPADDEPVAASEEQEPDPEPAIETNVHSGEQLEFPAPHFEEVPEGEGTPDESFQDFLNNLK